MQYHLESIKQTNPEMLKGTTAVQCARFASHLHSESQFVQEKHEQETTNDLKMLGRINAPHTL